MGKSLLNNIQAHRHYIWRRDSIPHLSKFKLQPVLWFVADLYYLLSFQILLNFLNVISRKCPFFLIFFLF